MFQSDLELHPVRFPGNKRRLQGEDKIQMLKRRGEQGIELLLPYNGEPRG